jgi:hypothetical protein
MPCRAGTAQVPPLSLTMSCFGRSLKESSCSGSNRTASYGGGLRMEPTRPLRLTGLSSLAGLHSLARSISGRLQYPQGQVLLLDCTSRSPLNRSERSLRDCALCDQATETTDHLYATHMRLQSRVVRLVRLAGFQPVSSAFLSHQFSTSQQPPASQQYFSLTTNQHQPSATSQPNEAVVLPPNLSGSPTMGTAGA